jgi:hypothetical protein
MGSQPKIIFFQLGQSQWFWRFGAMGIRIPYTKWGATKVSQRAHHICAALSGWLLIPCRTGGGTWRILEDHPNRGPWRSLLLENLPMMMNDDITLWLFDSLPWKDPPCY